MGRLGSGIRIFSPLSDVEPFSHRDGDTQLTIIRKIREKISEIIAALNTLNSHIRTAENGLEAKFTVLYDTAAANVQTFEDELQTKFAEAKADVDANMATKSGELDAQFATKSTELDAQYTTFTGTVDDAVAAAETAATNAQNSAAGAASSATDAANSAASSAASAAEAIAVGDSFVASLFNTIGSATRAAITGALAALGAWFGDDPDAPNAMITPAGGATFQSVATPTLTLAGEDLAESLLAKPQGMIAYGTQSSLLTNLEDTETTVFELRTLLTKNRLTDVILRAFAFQSTVAGDVFTVRIRTAYDGDAVTTASTVLVSDTITLTNANVNQVFKGLFAKINSGTWSDERESRFLVTIQRTTGTGVGSLMAATTNVTYIEIVDTGVAKAPVSTGTTTAKTTRTTVWNGSAMYQDGTGDIVTSAVVQYHQPFTNADRFAHVLFNNVGVSGETGLSLNTILSSIAAEDLVKAEVYVYATGGTIDTGGSDGLATDTASMKVRPSSATAASASFGASGSSWSTGAFPAGKWVDVTAAFTLASRSIHLVYGGNKDEKIIASNAASSPVQLRLTYNR